MSIDEFDARLDFSDGYRDGFNKASKHLMRGSMPDLQNVTRLTPYNNGYKRGWKEAQDFVLNTWDNGNV